MTKDSFGCKQAFGGEEKKGIIYSLEKAEDQLGSEISRLPVSLKVLLENLLRNEDGRSVKKEHIEGMVGWLKDGKSSQEIAYRPARVLMQDFTGVPAVADLAAMRDKVLDMGGDARAINPQVRVDLVIDHSVVVDKYGDVAAYEHNIRQEFLRNRERYEFLRWGQNSFRNFRVVPPGTGICHQVNLEYLAEVVWCSDDVETVYYPDTVIGTDSHTTMVNALGILGWGVGGIEAEAAMLGQPVSMMIPEVIGVRLTGDLREGITATDLVLVITNMLRSYGVVGKFVEFFGDGLNSLTLADRATISNMAPEYGATAGIFPVDIETLRYLEMTARDASLIKRVEDYTKAQGMWRSDGGEQTIYTNTLELNLSTVEPTLAGPRRPQDKIALGKVAEVFASSVDGEMKDSKEGTTESLADGHVMIAAITSCTNTSNPNVLLTAGLLAKNARERGLKVKPWVKTSLAPGSKVVTDYLCKAGVDTPLKELGFDLVGYGCTTCIGNSGPLDEAFSEEIRERNLNVAAVLSGNRNFEGRVHPLIKSNYLASPPLVVAYAIVGDVRTNIETEPLGLDLEGMPVYLRDIWPSRNAIVKTVEESVERSMFVHRYGNVFEGEKEWQGIKCTSKETYDWNSGSTYVQRPPFFDEMESKPAVRSDITDARALLILGDSVTTDHISPAGSFGRETPAGSYLLDHQVRPAEFNSYGSRRGNHKVMLRGTFANVRIRNKIAAETEGGFTKHYPTGEQMTIYDAAVRYALENTPLVVIGGKEYGTGSSRDWAAKGTKLLGVRAVIAESFERIHRSNLIGMGVLPLQFENSVSAVSLALDGSETFTLEGVDALETKGKIELSIVRVDATKEKVTLLVRIDTEDELSYFRHDGILPYVLRRLMSDTTARTT